MGDEKGTTFVVGATTFVLCPWHEERTPSCAINGDRVFCMGCGKDTTLAEYTALIQIRETRAGAPRRRRISELGEVVNMAGDQLLTYRQVADFWKVTPRTVRLWAEKGAIPVVRTPSGQPRVPSSAINTTDRQSS